MSFILGFRAVVLNQGAGEPSGAVKNSRGATNF